MAITTTPRPAYVWRCLVIAVLCLVFGVWGIYDYAYTIPARQRGYEKFVLVESVRDALESTLGSPDVEQKYRHAIELVQGELMLVIDDRAEDLALPDHTFDPVERTKFIVLLQIISKGRDVAAPGSAADTELIADAHRFHEDIITGDAAALTWYGQLLDTHAALLAGPRPNSQPLSGLPLAVYDWAQAVTNQEGEVTPPSAYDRPVQWMFILCLPFVPFYLAQFVRIRRRRYRLDDDGTLHLPDATWAAGDIADIDMSRWMSKSVAEVVHTDGTRARLDDYLHRDLHRIVGRLAHRFDPDQWNEDATRVKAAAAPAENDEDPADPA